MVLPRSPAATFYALQAGTLLLLWIAVLVGSGVDFLRLGEKLSNTALRPSWMPKKCFLTLLRSDIYRPAAYSIVPYMFLHAFAVEELEGMPLMVACSRSVAALAATIFHLGDSSRTSSHRDYLMLYICWVLAACGWINLLVPSGVDDVAQALAFGLCIWYIFSCGVSKVIVAGRVAGEESSTAALAHGFQEWALGDTLNAILETFARKSPRGGGPVLGKLTRSIVLTTPLLADEASFGFPSRAKRAMLNACAFATLVFECVLAPICLLVPIFSMHVPHLEAGYHLFIGGGMIFLHLAIGALQSGAIGAFFLPCAASYVYGLSFTTSFSSSVIGVTSSWEFWLPVVVTFTPVLGAFLARPATRLLPEHWPLTPMALFPWSAEQWVMLHSLLVRGETRLVALARQRSDSQEDLVGQRVIPIEYDAEVPLMDRVVAPRPDEGIVAYDLWSRVIGITTFQDIILQAVLESPASAAPPEERTRAIAQRILDATAEFLREEQRVVEVSTGNALTLCCFVRVDKQLRIAEVLATPTEKL